MLEALHVVLLLAFASAERDQVVVVKCDAMRTELCQPVHRLDRIQWQPRGVAEGSRACHPTVQRPNANLSSGVGTASWVILSARRTMAAVAPGADGRRGPDFSS
jgi:hypothetical protein